MLPSWSVSVMPARVESLDAVWSLLMVTPAALSISLSAILLDGLLRRTMNRSSCSLTESSPVAMEIVLLISPCSNVTVPPLTAV